MNTRKASLILWLAVCFAALPQARAQEWRWANYWTGNDGSGNFNQITNTAIDDDGNVYVFGSFGGNAVLHATDGDRRFSDIPEVVSSNREGWVLAKFDSLGNYVWSKCVKSWNRENRPLWMEMKGNEINVMGLYLVSHENPLDWFYHLDSLADLPAQNNTMIATFDLDGNLIEDHYLYHLSRGNNSIGYRNEVPFMNSCFHRDSDGNTYIFTGISYSGWEEDPLTLVVDNEREYDIYLPGNTDSTLATRDFINNELIYKFSPEWELLWAKRMVNRTDGVAPPGAYYENASTQNVLFSPIVNGLTFDEDDNMYVVGYIQLGLWGNYGGECNSYPAHIYWDSTHYATILDISSSESLPFIIKYNTEGEVQWCKQLYSHGGQDFSVRHQFSMGCVDDRYCYVVGRGINMNPDPDHWIAFDREGQVELARSQPSQNHSAFFASYNKLTGEYVTHGIVPAVNRSTVSTDKTVPAVINNQIYCMSFCTPTLADVGILLNRWSIDGTYLDSDTITATYQNQVNKIGRTTIDNNGHICVDFGGKTPYSFPNGIHLDCSTTQGNAIFAFKYDQRAMVPYPVGIAENPRDEGTLTLYPNPASDILTLELSGNERISKVEVYDLSGKLMGRYKGSAINVKNLPAGIYIVTVCAGKEKCAAKFEKL